MLTEQKKFEVGPRILNPKWVCTETKLSNYNLPSDDDISIRRINYYRQDWMEHHYLQFYIISKEIEIALIRVLFYYQFIVTAVLENGLDYFFQSFSRFVSKLSKFQQLQQHSTLDDTFDVIKEKSGKFKFPISEQDFKRLRLN